MKANYKWTKDEENILIENYEKNGPKKCSELIGRTLRACEQKAKHLNIKFNPAHRYNKELLEIIINESNNKIECLSKLGLNPHPGNYDTLKKYIKLYNIDTSHFTNNYTALNKYVDTFVKKNMNDILVENSTFNRHTLKERLYKEGYKERKCEICGQTEYWNDKKMSLILDHINGVNDDNRIENLRIVCPNCNATLDTHCRGSKYKFTEEGNKIYQIDSNHDLCKCGKEKWKVSKTCNGCRGLSQRKVERPSKEQLLKEVEESNYCEVGRKYGVSDNTIRKWLKIK